jgi:hypothetical protein
MRVKIDRKIGRRMIWGTNNKGTRTGTSSSAYDSVCNSNSGADSFYLQTEQTNRHTNSDSVLDMTTTTTVLTTMPMHCNPPDNDSAMTICTSPYNMNHNVTNSTACIDGNV